MKKLLLSLLLIAGCATIYATTFTISNSGFTFNPSSITINVGDDVNFSLAGDHNAVEVSQATWNANGNTPLAAGFGTPFGGGMVTTSQLAMGTHYYVCSPHASMGMKGVIIVQGTTDIFSNHLQPDLAVFPNPANNQVTLKSSNTLIGSRYFIADQAGRSVYKNKITDEVNSVDISKLRPGVYLIQLEGLRGRSVKIVKK
jgi:plastocyanin